MRISRKIQRSCYDQIGTRFYGHFSLMHRNDLNRIWSVVIVFIKGADWLDKQKGR